MDQPVENIFPIGIARKVVIGDEKPVDPLREILPDDPLHIVRRSPPRLAPLYVDDGAEGAQKRAPAAGVEAGQAAAGAFDPSSRKNRNSRPFQSRQIVHVVVERLERAVPGVPENLLKPALGFSG